MMQASDLLDDKPVAGTPLSAWLTLAVLLLFYLVSCIDKQMIALAIDPMGRSLGLQDSELGLLVGAAFGVPYTLTVLAAGWLLDRYSKRAILLFAVAIWSLAAMATGLAHSFGQLVLARAIVGIGEGFLPPASLALIAAVFPRHRVAMATSIFFAGANIGVMVALSLGGQVIEWLTAQGGAIFPLFGHLAPWRAAFFLTALPGLPLAFLALLIDREASRSAVEESDSDEAGQQIGYAVFFRSRLRLILCHSLAFGMISSGCLAVMLWSPAYLERNFGWASGRVGLVLALGSGCGAMASILWGAMSDRLMRKGRSDAPYIVYPVILAVCVPITILAYTFAEASTFLIPYLLASMLLLGCGGITSAMQLSTPPQFRARILGLQTMSAGIFGLALVPVLVPSLAQYMFRDRLAIGHSISIVVLITVLIAILLLISTRGALRDAVTALEDKDGR